MTKHFSCKTIHIIEKLQCDNFYNLCLSFASFMEIFCYMYGLEIDEKELEVINKHILKYYSKLDIKRLNEINGRIDNKFESPTYALEEYALINPFKKDYENIYNEDFINIIKINTKAEDFFRYFRDNHEEIFHNAGKPKKYDDENVKRNILKMVRKR